MGAVHGLLQRDFIEVNGRLCEFIENKYQHSGQQNEKLHGHLEQSVEHEPEAAFADRGTRKITLHLALVRTEIAQLQKEPANDAAPDIVAVAEVKIQIDDIHLSGIPGHCQRLVEVDMIIEIPDQEAKGKEHAREDDGHLLFVGLSNGFLPATDRINDDQYPDKKDGKPEAPAQNF